MNNLILLPFHDYKFVQKNGFSTRDTHIYEYFMNDESIDTIIIVNRPTSLAEILIRRKKIRSTSNIIYKSNGLYIQELKKGVYIIDFFVSDLLAVIIKKHSWLPYIYSSDKIYRKVLKALEVIGISEYSCYMSSPFSTELGLKLNANSTVLDAVDNLTKFENWAYFHDRIHELYQLAKDNFDHIVVNSKDSLKYFGENCSADLEFIANGADRDRFSGDFERPDDLPLDGPIVGYVGKIQRMFDAKLLSDLAVSNPDTKFVIIGQILDNKWKRTIWDKYLAHLQNVLFIGFKKYDLLPAYYSHFDICIIPYIIENQHGGDPIKFYEYMASCRPIVSMNIGEIKQYHNGKNIFICENKESFVASFNRLKNDINEGTEIHYNTKFNSWKNVSERIKEKLFP